MAGNNGVSKLRGDLFNIGDRKRRFLYHDAGMHINVFNFGYPLTKTTFNSYILQLPDGDYSIYREKLCHDSRLQNLVEGWNLDCMILDVRGGREILAGCITLNPSLLKTTA